MPYCKEEITKIEEIEAEFSCQYRNNKFIRCEESFKIPEIVIDMSFNGQEMGFKDGFSFAIDSCNVKGIPMTCIVGGTY